MSTFTKAEKSQTRIHNAEARKKRLAEDLEHYSKVFGGKDAVVNEAVVTLAFSYPLEILYILCRAWYLRNICGWKP